MFGSLSLSLSLSLCIYIYKICALLIAGSQINSVLVSAGQYLKRVFQLGVGGGGSAEGVVGGGGEAWIRAPVCVIEWRQYC